MRRAIATAGKRHEVTLNAKKYAIVGPVREQPASEFAANINIGRPQDDSRENASFWSMASWTGGLGIQYGDFREHQGRFWNGDGADTRFANQLTLGPLVSSHGSVTTGTSLLTYGSAHFYEYKNLLYLSVGDRVYRNDSGTTWNQVLDMGSNQAGPLISFYASDGTEYLYAGVGIGDTAGSSYSDTGDSGDWTTIVGTGNQGALISAVEYDRKLVIGTALGIRYTTAADTWTNLVTFSRAVRAMVSFLNRAGDPTIFTYDAQGKIHEVDFWSRQVYPVEVGLTRNTNEEVPYNGRGMIVWNQALYISNHGGVTKVNPDLSFQAVGPDRDQGMPSGFGKYMGFFAQTPAFLFGFRSRKAGESTDSAILCYTGIGWHILARTTATIRGMYVSQGSPQYLYWAEAENNTSVTIKRIRLAVGNENPVNDTTYTYAASNYLVTPWVDLGFFDLNKVLLRMSIDAQALSTDETVAVGYQLDGASSDSDAFTSLGTFSGSTTTLDFGSGAGIAAKSIRFKFTLARGSTNTNTPKVRSIKLQFLVTPDYRAQKAFAISIGETRHLRGSPKLPAEDILEELKTAYDANTLVTFQHGSDASTYVKVVSIPVQVYDTAGNDREGTVTVQVLEPLT